MPWQIGGKTSLSRPPVCVDMIEPSMVKIFGKKISDLIIIINVTILDIEGAVVGCLSYSIIICKEMHLMNNNYS
jgi:hypothetical protein